MLELHPIDKAIASHARWKSQLRQAIESGQSELSVELARSDKLCDFGRWLLDQPQEQRANDHYRTVSELHSQFHRAASSVLELALAGRRQEAEAAMALGSTFAGVSARLTASMTAWKRAIGGN
jgi:methyl-accepting chemotaxis protein